MSAWNGFNQAVDMDNCKCCLMRLSRIGLACQFGAYESIHTYSLLCCGNGKVAMYQGWYPHPELPTIPFICNWRRDDFAVALHILNRLGHDLHNASQSLGRITSQP